MGITDKVKNAAEEAAARTKEQISQINRDKHTEGESRSDPTKDA